MRNILVVGFGAPYIRGLTIHPEKYSNGFPLLYFAVVKFQLILSISFRVTSAALGQSYGYPSTSNTTLKNTGFFFKGCGLISTRFLSISNNDTKCIYMIIFFSSQQSYTKQSKCKSTISELVLALYKSLYIQVYNIQSKILTYSNGMLNNKQAKAETLSADLFIKSLNNICIYKMRRV